MRRHTLRLLAIFSLIVLLIGEAQGSASSFAPPGQPAATSTPASAPPPGLTYATSVGGQINSIAKRDHLLYLTMGGTFKVIDVSTPASPRQRGKLRLYHSEHQGNYFYGGNVAIQIAGNYAFVSPDSTPPSVTWYVVDIRNPDRPVKVGIFPRTEPAVTFVDTRAFLYGADFHIVDISNPLQPVEVGSFLGPTGYGPGVVEGNRAYLLHNSVMRVLDISNPAQIVLLSSHTISTSQFEYVNPNFAVRNQVAYVNITRPINDYTTENSFRGIDYTNPASPVTRWQSPTEYNDGGSAVGGGVTIYGSRLYVGGKIYDISNPDQVTLIGRFGMDSTMCQGVALFDLPIVYCGNNRVAMEPILSVVDTTNPAASVRLATLDLTEPPGMETDQVIVPLFTYGRGGSLAVYDVSLPAQTRLITEAAVPGFYNTLLPAGERLYVWGNDIWRPAIYSYDVSDPARPQLQGTYQPTNLAPETIFTEMEVAGSHLYIGLRSPTEKGMLVVDVSNPAQPAEVARYLSSYASFAGLDPTTNQAYLLGTIDAQQGRAAVEILDTTNPLSPTLRGTYAMQTEPWGTPFRLEPHNGYLYLSYITGGFDIVDVRTPTSPRFVRRYSDINVYRMLEVHGSLAYGININQDIYILNVQDPENPSIVVAYKPPYSAYNHLVMARPDLTIFSWTSHNVERVFFEVEPALFPTSTVISPTGGTLSNHDGTVQLEVPAGAVTAPITLTYRPNVPPTAPLEPHQSALRTFELTASTLQGTPIGQFQQPITLTVRYSARDLRRGPVLEPTLSLALLEEDAWVDQLPCADCSVDLDTNHISIPLGRLASLSLYGVSHRQYLPLAGR